MKISVFNRQRSVPFNLPWLKRLAPSALAECKKHPATGAPEIALAQLEAVEIIIVSDARIAAIHEQFMNIPGATDVITFEHGEIVISAETAKRNSQDFHQPIEHELALYVIHGLLHLNGYDDRAPADAKQMRELQEKILSACLQAVETR